MCRCSCCRSIRRVGHRRVPRRDRRAAGRDRLGNEAEAYANDVVPEARGAAGPHPAGGRGLSRADRGRGAAARRRASTRSTSNTRTRAGAHPRAPLYRDDGARARRRRQGRSSTRPPRAGRRSPYLPLGDRRFAPLPGRPRSEKRPPSSLPRADRAIARRPRWRARCSTSRRPSRRSCCASASLSPGAASITEPGLHFKVPLIENVVKLDNRILDARKPRTGGSRRRQPAARRRRLHPLPHRRPAEILSGGRHHSRRQQPARLRC